MFIDSDFLQKLTDVAMENTQKMMEKFGMPADQMDKALGRSKNAHWKTIYPGGSGGSAISYGIGLIIYAVLSLFLLFL
jgi:hypothetical protein